MTEDQIDGEWVDAIRIAAIDQIEEGIDKILSHFHVGCGCDNDDCYCDVVISDVAMSMIKPLVEAIKALGGWTLAVWMVDGYPELDPADFNWPRESRT